MTRDPFDNRQTTGTPNGPHSRREFLASLARGGALAGMAALVAALWKPGRSGAVEPDCTRRGICRACPRTPDCPLPAALSFRDEQKGA